MIYINILDEQIIVLARTTTSCIRFKWLFWPFDSNIIRMLFNYYILTARK